jgi:tRNA pseudouridine55 synthase
MLTGVLLLDKPAGLTSTQALGRAKWLIGEKKAGHTGTLDPFATGLLPLCFGEATKFSRFALDATKGYTATLKLGVTTTTGDPEGEVLATRPVAATAEQFAAACAAFLGNISQVPPMYSALKRDGVPLYELARKGQVVERAPRAVTIYEIQVQSFLGDVAQIHVLASKGTYIRTLAEDIGARLGCGAHLTALRRTRVGALHLAEATTLEAIEAMPKPDRARVLLPAESLISELPQTTLSDSDARAYRHGQTVVTDAGDAETVTVRDASGQLLGIGSIQAGRLKAIRSISNES